MGAFGGSKRRERAQRRRIMPDPYAVAPESTAERVALWRALHMQIDAPPHVLEDDIGLRLLSPGEDWRGRPDMDPQRARAFRASIVARARFIEDLVGEAAARGIGQYVILGAGLDTFAQRRPDVVSHMTVFEVDQPGPQAWKKQRLVELGFGVSKRLRFVPVDFESGDSWWEALLRAGFTNGEPAILTCTGVSLYLTNAAIGEMLRRIASLAPGSTFAMTFMLPLDSVEPAERAAFATAIEGARAGGTPFISFFAPAEIVAMAQDAGFKAAYTVSGTALAQRYFGERRDNLRPGNAEHFLIATT
jgi:methyltransferase (TIGR00027 family)